MWDMSSGKSRGYGFLAFRDKTDAEQAIATMNGEWLGSRAIRVNWANQKTQTGGLGGAGGGMGGAPGGGGGMRMGGAGGAPAPMNFQGGPLSFDVVAAQTPAFNTTVYVGNLIPYTTQADLIPLFQGYGYIVEIRMQADKGFAFVKLDTHENAAMAICQLQGQLVHGRPVKCSWGKDRVPGGGEGGQPGGGMGGQPGGAMPGYGMVRSFLSLPPPTFPFPLLSLLRWFADSSFSCCSPLHSPRLACTACPLTPTASTPLPPLATLPTDSSQSFLIFCFLTFVADVRPFFVLSLQARRAGRR